MEAEREGKLRRIWKTEIPSTIKILGWRIMLNRLPTRDQLARRRIIHNAHEEVCVFYFEEEENLSRIYIYIYY